MAEARVTLQDTLNQAVSHHSAGRFAVAVPLYQEVLASEPGHADANHFLGMILVQHGHAEKAVEFLAKASASPAATPEMHNNFGVALHGLKRNDEAAGAFSKALTARPGYAEAFNNLGSIYKEAGRFKEAVVAFRRAVELQPDYPVAQENLRATYGEVVPSWHFAMMNDGPRNDAYDKVIRRLAPGKRVLDIGTGAGLLAMMSARAGAAEVITCEQVELIADHAKQIIAANGLAEKIRVFGKSSTALVAGREIPGRADVIVTETFSSGLLGEGVLPTLEHAHAELLAEDGVVVPMAAAARGYLIGGASLRDKLYVSRAAGFDLRPFAAFAPAKVGLCLDHEPHEVMSKDVELIRFDLMQKGFPAESHVVEVTATKDGECVGVAQWLKLELDASTTYENRPSPKASGATWVHIVYRFAAPKRVAKGEVLKLAVRHDRAQISVDLIA